MSLASLLIGKRPPVLEELEVVGSGASASSVVRAVVRDAGGFSKLRKGQVIAVKKVYVPHHSVIQVERQRRREQSAAAANELEVIEEETWDDEEGSENDGEARRGFSTTQGSEDEGNACDSQDTRRCEAIEREVSLLKSLNHPNIVSCYGVTPLQDRNMLGILMEYCGGNSLRHYYRGLQQNDSCDTGHLVRHPGLPEETVRGFAAQMLSGLQYLHSNGVVHRDLKGLNVLLGDDLQTCKLADFGSATQIALAGSDARFHSMQGTIWWMAPEQFLLGKTGCGKEHCVDGAGGSFGADIWSLGCTILELAIGAIPFTHVSGGQFGLMLLLTRSTYNEDDLLPPSVVNLVPPKVMAFVRRCLVRDPNERPTAATLVQDPWIQGAAVPSPRPSRIASAVMSRQGSNSVDSFATPDPSSVASPDSITSASSPEMVIPDGIPEKLHSAVLFWHKIVKSTDGTITIRDLFSHMRVPTLADIVAPFFAFPSGHSGGSDTLSACHPITFPTFLMFVSYFGPFDTLMSDLWALEAEKYAFVGYASYGTYADYECTDSSHLLLSCLSKPYIKLTAGQNVVEEDLKCTCAGTFMIRFSSKFMESPGSLTLSVKGDNGVLHYRITRPADGWGFLMVLPTKKRGGDNERTSRHRPTARGIQRQHDLATLTGHRQLADTTTAVSPLLCFDTIEDLVKYFSLHGIPNLRGDKTHKLRLV